MRLWLAALVLTLCAAGAVAADDIATRAAALLQKARPDYTVVVADPLTVKFGPPGKPPFQLNLDRIAQACDSDPEDCDATLAGFIDKASHVADVEATAVTPDRLRAVVRPADYIASLQRLMQTKKPDAALVSAPLAGDLVEACFLDLPAMLRPVEAHELTPLGLDTEAALALCEKNAAAALPPIPPPEGAAIKMLAGDPYESSYFALHDAWAARAAAFGGHLLVAVPGADIVLYARDEGPASVVAMRAAVQLAARTTERPIAPTIFRWTPTGWDVVPGDV
jgi:hypothetical protein